MSPFTVPSTTRASGFVPLCASSGRRTAKTSFVARAAIRSSGTKQSPSSNRRPTAVMAGLMLSPTIWSGGVPDSRARRAAATAAAESPLTTASRSF